MILPQRLSHSLSLNFQIQKKRLPTLSGFQPSSCFFLSLSANHLSFTCLHTLKVDILSCLGQGCSSRYWTVEIASAAGTLLPHASCTSCICQTTLPSGRCKFKLVMRQNLSESRSFHFAQEPHVLLRLGGMKRQVSRVEILSSQDEAVEPQLDRVWTVCV